MDALLFSTQKYAGLCRYAYDCVIGRKNTSVTLRFAFSPYEYHHLSGLQHLKHPGIHKNSERVMKDVLEKKIDLELLQTASNWEEVKESTLARLEALAQLEFLMDGFQTIYGFSKQTLLNARPPIRTQIDADYLVKFQLRNGTTFFFSIRNRDTYCGCSLFTNDRLDYSAGQMKYIVLEKKKINLETGEETLLYRRASYHPE